MNKKTKITPAKVAAILAAGVAGALPATATTALPGAQGSTVRTAPAKQDRSALPVQTQARAQYGIRMLGGGFDPRLFANAYSAPWMAPRYNQRKARRNARRVNKAVQR